MSQSLMPDQIRFFDDGAGDCGFLKELYPDVDFVFREKNLGIVKNFDDALRRTETEYVLFIGADNWLRSDAIEALTQRDADIITYDIVVTGQYKDEIRHRHGDQVSDFRGDIYWQRNHKHHGSMMYRTEIGQRYGYQRAKTAQCYTEEDRSIWEAMISGGASVEHVAEGLLYYRRHANNYFQYNGMKKSRPTENKNSRKRSIFRSFFDPEKFGFEARG